MAESIEHLRIYKVAREAEDKIYEICKALPADQYYGLGNDLRRSSASVSHHIMGAHRLYSYRLKLDELAAMRRECEHTQTHLEQAKLGEFSGIMGLDELITQYSRIIMQSWGLTKWLKTKLEEAGTPQPALEQAEAAN
jgi:four helix bundle protein